MWDEADLVGQEIEVSTIVVVPFVVVWVMVNKNSEMENSVQ